MHFQINPTYVIIGVILIAAGLLAQRLLTKKQPVIVAVEKPLQIGFHVGEEANSDTILEPSDDILEPVEQTKKSKGPSFLQGLRRSITPKAQQAEAPIDDAIATDTLAADPEPALADRAAHIEARVNNVPRLKNPLRFSTKRIPETPAPPESTDGNTTDADTIAKENLEPKIDVAEQHVDGHLPTPNQEELPRPEDVEHVIPKLELVPAYTPSVTDVTEDMIAHLLRTDPIPPSISTISRKPEPEEDLPISFPATEHHEPVLDDDIPVVFEDSVSEYTQEPHTTMDLEDLVIPATTNVNDMPEEDDVDVPLHASTIATSDDDDDSPIDFSGGLGMNDEERRQLLAEMEEDELAQAALDDEDVEEIDDHQQMEPEHLPSVIAIPPRVEAEVPSAPTILPTFRWTTFIGEDAQSLGTSERANLVRLLRDMHDAPRCLPALMEAFNEEQPEELRPAVLEAITHSYSNDALKPLYEYCLEYGSEREKELAQRAIDDLG
jgi:hypothetical protein